MYGTDFAMIMRWKDKGEGFTNKRPFRQLARNFLRINKALAIV
jgi:hypothetical protein